MKHYIIQAVEAAPDWTAVPVLSVDTPYLETKDTVKAWAQICHGMDALHIHLWADVPVIRAVETGPVGMPCEDSCLEFFFQPVNGDPRYMNLEFNFNGCFYLGLGTCVDDLIRLIPDCDASEIFKPEIKKTEAGWEIFYQIPYAFIRRLFPDFAPKSGMTIRGNCYACSDLSEPAYYLSWNRVTTDPFTFHRSSCFGTMTLA